MKTTILIFFVLYLTSCSEKLDILHNGPDIPVIYCLLNPEDSVHVVRLTKSFSGHTDAFEMAKDPENVYYNDALISIQVTSHDGWPISTLYFIKKDYPDRVPGVFTLTNPVHIYEGSLISILKEGSVLSLSVILGDNHIVSSQQEFNPSPKILSPKSSNQTKLSFFHGDPFKISWEDKKGYQYYEVEVRVNYSDHYETGDSIRSIMFSHSVKSSKDRENDSYSPLFNILEGQMIMRSIGKMINHNNAVRYRKFRSIDISLLSVTQEFLNYTDPLLIATDKSGLPISNINGGTGLFALYSKTEQPGYLIDQNTLDSLAKGQFTKHLGFINY